MATIRKRVNGYQIRVSCGYDANGKQVTRTKSWKPKPNMTKKQIEKELNRQAVLFEEACMNGLVTSSVKFCDFIEQWKDGYAKKNYKLMTIDTMQHIMKRVNEELGHMRLSKISRRHIQAFINSLSDGNEKYKPLGPKTVRNYINYTSSIFEYAIRLDLVSNNPCSKIILPALKKVEREVYTLTEAQTFIDTLIQKAPIVFQTYFILAIYGGLRRGELCGLTWNDIDFENEIISIDKALYHISNKGSTLDTPKSASSNRSLKLPSEVFEFFRKLKIFYENEKCRLGSYWNDTEFVFKDEDGNSLSPLKPNRWLHRFCENENLKYITPHSFRHLCASLMIDSGASVKTVQACLGHSDASTTLNIYAHSFAKAQAKASEAVASNFKLS